MPEFSALFGSPKKIIHVAIDLFSSDNASPALLLHLQAVWKLIWHTHYILSETAFVSLKTSHLAENGWIEYQ